MKLSETRIRQFQSLIFRWWKTNKRDLPWRHTRDPYNIAVSEVMLQQTQVSRVITRYREFIGRYPTVFDLAHASTADVLRSWKGMGYNRRALYLHKMAKEIVTIYGGIFPKELKLLTKLPGLGNYTARAILVFAYNKPISCVDTNIRQIITHFFFDDTDQHPQVIQKVADQLVPGGKSWEWHQALMDYGAVNAGGWRHSGRLSRAGSGESQGTEQKHIPFAQTDRFIRGKIVDILRSRPYQQTDLVESVAEVCKQPVERVKKIMKRLQHEGLVVTQRKIVSLPE